MHTIIFFLIIGLLTGRLLRQQQRIGWLHGFDRLFIPTLAGMILFLAMSVMSSHLVIVNMTQVMSNAILMTLAAMAGSIVVAMTLQSFLSNHMVRSKPNIPTTREQYERRMHVTVLPTTGKNFTIAFWIAGSFLIGSIIGFFRMPWLTHPEVIELGKSISLSLIILLVGISLGSDRRVVRMLRNSGPCIFILPLAIMLGTWLGSAAISHFLSGVEWYQAMSIASGFGFYSASSSIITKFGSPILGLTALLVNLMREFLTLLFAPQMARLFGPFGLIASGGATTMNSTLPMISLTTGKEYVVLAFCSGLILSLLVPFLVTLLIQM